MGNTINDSMNDFSHQFGTIANYIWKGSTYASGTPQLIQGQFLSEEHTIAFLVPEAVKYVKKILVEQS